MLCYYICNWPLIFASINTVAIYTMSLASRWATDEKAVEEAAAQDTKVKQNKSVWADSSDEEEGKDTKTILKAAEKVTKKIETPKVSPSLNDIATTTTPLASKIVRKLESRWASSSDEEEDEVKVVVPQQSTKSQKSHQREADVKQSINFKKGIPTEPSSFRREPVSFKREPLSSKKEPVSFKREPVSFKKETIEPVKFNKEPMHFKPTKRNDDDWCDLSDEDENEKEEEDDDEEEEEEKEQEWEDDESGEYDSEVEEEENEEEEEDDFVPKPLSELSKDAQGLAARLGLVTPPTSAGNGKSGNGYTKLKKPVKKEFNKADREKKERAETKERFRKEREVEREKYKNQRMNDSKRDWDKGRTRAPHRAADEDEEEDLIPRFNNKSKWKGDPPTDDTPPLSPRKSQRDYQNSSSKGRRFIENDNNSRYNNNNPVHSDRRSQRNNNSRSNLINSSSSGPIDSHEKKEEVQYEPVKFAQTTKEDFEKFMKETKAPTNWADDDDGWW